jgi:hypothetical protein
MEETYSNPSCHLSKGPTEFLTRELPNTCQIRPIQHEIETVLKKKLGF